MGQPTTRRQFIWDLRSSTASRHSMWDTKQLSDTKAVEALFTQVSTDETCSILYNHGNRARK